MSELVGDDLAEEIELLRLDEIFCDHDPVRIADAQARRAKKRARKLERQLFWQRLRRALNPFKDSSNAL